MMHSAPRPKRSESIVQSTFGAEELSDGAVTLSGDVGRMLPSEAVLMTVYMDPCCDFLK